MSRHVLRIAAVIAISALIAGCDLGTPRTTIAGPATALAPTDVNDDGRTDLVRVGAGDISLLIATSDGSFDRVAVTERSPGDASFIDVTTVDADTDGDDDLVVLEELGNPDVEFLYLYENLGTGEYQPRGLASYVIADDVSAGDVNADSIDDLVLVDRSGVGQVVLAGDGAGGFAPLTTLPTMFGSEVELADLDGDGRDEVLVATEATTPPAQAVVEIHRFTGTAWLPPVVVPTAADLRASSLTVADVDDDGHLDVVTANSSDLAATAGSISVLLGHGDGTLSAPVVTTGAPRLDDRTEVGTGDFDGDGHADVVVAHGGGVSVLFGDGTGALHDEHVLAPTGGAGTDVEVLDVDGDGIDDVASAGQQANVFVNRLGGGRTHS